MWGNRVWYDLRPNSATIWYTQNQLRQRLEYLELSGRGTSIEARELQKRIESCGQIVVTGHRGLPQ